MIKNCSRNNEYNVCNIPSVFMTTKIFSGSYMHVNCSTNSKSVRERVWTKKFLKSKQNRFDYMPPDKNGGEAYHFDVL